MRFNISKELEGASGIYIITNSVNEYCYIGMTLCFRTRYLAHKSSINQNINKALSAFAKEYGIETMIFSMLEEVKRPELLRKREIYHIKKARKSGNKLLNIAFHKKAHKKKILSKSEWKIAQIYPEFLNFLKEKNLLQQSDYHQISKNCTASRTHLKSVVERQIPTTQYVYDNIISFYKKKLKDEQNILIENKLSQ